MLASPFEALGQTFDSLCRQSGTSGATKNCVPAKKKEWVHDGGSYSLGLYTSGQKSLDAVFNYFHFNIDSMFCSGPQITKEGDWVTSIDGDALHKQYAIVRLSGLMPGGLGACNQVVDSTTTLNTSRDQTYYCDAGQQGPHRGRSGERWCVLRRASCPMTPDPVAVSDGSKHFAAVSDSRLLDHFRFQRSYSSHASVTGFGLLNPPKARSDAPELGDSSDNVGWQATYDARIWWSSNIAGTTTVLNVDIPGENPYAFVAQQGGGYTATQNDGARLAAVQGVGWVFAHPNGSVWSFASPDGLLSFIQQSDGSRRIELVRNTARQLTAAQDAFGRTLQVNLGSRGEIQSLVSPSGAVYGLGYDGVRRFASMQVSEGSSTRGIVQYLYEHPDEIGAITGVIDGSGVQTHKFTYDNAGRVLRTDRLGAGGALVNSYQLTYGSPVSVTDPNGATVSYSFGGNAVTKVVGSSQPAGSGCAAATRSVILDANDNALATNDFNGNRTCRSFIANRGLELTAVSGLSQYSVCAGYETQGVALPAGARKTTTQWHPDWRLRTKVAEAGRITTYIYNGQPDPFNGNVVASCAPGSALLADGKPIAVLCRQVEQATTDANGAAGFAATLQSGVPNREQKWTYNQYGQVLTHDGPRTDVADITTYAYYVDTSFTGSGSAAVGHTIGDLQSVTNAVGKLTQYTKYDKVGQVVEVVDPNGVVTTNGYDMDLRLVTSTTSGQTTSYTYDAAGLLKKVTKPDGSWIGYDYDPAHRQTAVYDNLGNRIDYTLDNAGNRTAENVKDSSGALRRQLARSIDALGRVQQTNGVN